MRHKHVRGPADFKRKMATVGTSGTKNNNNNHLLVCGMGQAPTMLNATVTMMT